MRRRAFLASGLVVGITGCTDGDFFGSSPPISDDPQTDRPARTESETERPPEPEHELIEYDPYLEVDWNAVTRHKSTYHNHPRNTFSTPAEVVDFYRGEQAGALGRTVADDEQYNVFSITEKGNDPMMYPWTEFSNIDSDWENRNPEAIGVVSFPASESVITEHVTSLFTTIVDDYIDSEDRFGVIEEILGREVFYEPKGLAILGHPDRYVDGPGDWERYREDLESFSREDGLVGTDVFSRTDPVGETLRPLWDNMLSEFAPERMIWGFGADDASNYRIPIDGDVRWTTLLLDDDEFDPADQERSRRAAMAAYLEGRSFASARRPQWDEELQEAYPTAVPTIQAIEVDDEGITIHAQDHDQIRWISDGEVVTTGPSIVLVPEHAHYVRAELESHDGDNHGMTCTQPWGIATDQA